MFEIFCCCILRKGEFTLFFVVVKLDFEIAVDQQTKAHDRTFEGVRTPGSHQSISMFVLKLSVERLVIIIITYQLVTRNLPHLLQGQVILYTIYTTMYVSERPKTRHSPLNLPLNVPLNVPLNLPLNVPSKCPS